MTVSLGCYIEEAHAKGTIKRAKTKFCCKNAPRPLAGRFFAVGMLRDPSPAIFSLWKCSATPRRPFFRCGNAPRPLAGHFFVVEMLRDPSQPIFSLWKCFATPRRPFFRCGNAPRPLADRFFVVEMLSDSA